MITTLHLAALAAVAATSAALAAPRDDPLAHHRGQHRVLVVLAASPADKLVARQHDLSPRCGPAPRSATSFW